MVPDKEDTNEEPVTTRLEEKRSSAPSRVQEKYTVQWSKRDKAPQMTVSSDGSIVTGPKVNKSWTKT